MCVPPMKRRTVSRKDVTNRGCTQEPAQRRSPGVNRGEEEPAPANNRRPSAHATSHHRGAQRPSSRIQSGIRAPSYPQSGDVLHRHQKRNGRPRSPDVDHLHRLHERGDGNVDGDNEEQDECDDDQDEDDEDENGEQPVRSSRRRSDGPTPTQIKYYPPIYRSLLEKAKKQSRLEALDNPFPDRETFLNEDAPEILAQLHETYAQEGRGVEEHYWKKHSHAMAILVYFYFLFDARQLIPAIVVG